MEGTCTCPNVNDCTVFINNISHNEIIGHSYRDLYCLQVNKKYKMCKRYHAYLKLGNDVPRDILPNSLLKIEELSH